MSEIKPKRAKTRYAVNMYLSRFLSRHHRIFASIRMLPNNAMHSASLLPRILLLSHQ